MKKFLALVLALVMTFSLVTISAGAKEYTDDSAITYEDAVDVISTLGIVGGYDNGSFAPKGTLTRGAAAKIICNMILGPTTASALGATSAPFSDVPANHTFAGYITYCAQQGIINGYADGTFKPAGTLTGYQFMKMLLGALGYDASVEGFTGANYTINVAKLALGLGLNKGNDDFVGSKAVTREEACLYAFNTLQATMVYYSNKTEVTNGNMTVTITGNRWEQDQGSYADIFEANKQANERTLQFAERYFPKLRVGAPLTDDFGRPANTWYYNNAKIDTYTEDATLTYTAPVALNDIYKDLGLSAAKTTDDYVIDGKDATDISISRDGKNNTSAVVKIGGNGVLTQVYYNTTVSPATLRITEVHTYVATVGSVKAATATTDRTITLSQLTTPGTSNYTYETEAFAQKDLVTYTAAYDTTSSKYVVKSVEALAKTDAGKLTAYVGTDAADASANFTANGSVYKYSRNGYVKNGPINNLGLKAELDVYCDQYGYAIYVEATKTSTNYAVVLGIGDTNAYGDATNGATLLLADGTKATVSYKMATNGGTLTDPNKVNDITGDLVTYTVGSDGVYTLTVADKYDTTSASSTATTNGRSALTIGGNSSLYATSATVYFVCTGTAPSNLTYKVYTGYAAMPTVGATNAVAGFAYKTNATYTSQVDAVYIAAASVLGLEGDSIYVLRTPSVNVVSEIEKEAYVELPAVVDGTPTTVKVAYALMDTAADASAGTPADPLYAAKGYILDAVTTNSDGIITGVTVKASGITPATGTVAVNNGVVGFGNDITTAAYWAYRGDTTVVYVSADGKTLSTSTVEGIATDANDTVEYIVDTATKTVTAIYIKVVD